MGPGGATAAKLSPTWKSAEWLWIGDNRYWVWATDDRFGVLDTHEIANSPVRVAEHGQQPACSKADDDSVVVVSAAGTVGLYNGQGEVRASATNALPSRSCFDLHLSPAGPSAFVAPSGAPGTLLNERQAFTYGTPGEPPVYLKPVFAPHGRWVVVGVAKDRIGVVETATGELRLQHPWEETTGRSPEFSPDGNWLTVPNGDHTVTLFNTSSFREIRRVPGDMAWFSAPDRFITEAGMLNAKPLVRMWSVSSSRAQWQRRNVGVDTVEPRSPTGRYLVGGDEGYAVIDAITGRTLSRWRGSRYGCGYSWLWLDDRLVFAEGGLTTFWEPGKRARTEPGECEGSLLPLLDPHKKVVVTFATAWDLTASSRLFVVQDSDSATVIHGWSPSGQHLLGTGERDEHFAMGWSAQDGRLAWQTSVDIEWGEWRIQKHAYFTAREAPTQSPIALFDADSGEHVWLLPCVSSQDVFTWFAATHQCRDGPLLPEVGLHLRQKPQCHGLAERWRKRLLAAGRSR